MKYIITSWLFCYIPVYSFTSLLYHFAPFSRFLSCISPLFSLTYSYNHLPCALTDAKICYSCY